MTPSKCGKEEVFWDGFEEEEKLIGRETGELAFVAFHFENKRVHAFQRIRGTINLLTNKCRNFFKLIIFISYSRALFSLDISKIPIITYVIT